MACGWEHGMQEYRWMVACSPLRLQIYTMLFTDGQAQGGWGGREEEQDTDGQA